MMTTIEVTQATLISSRERERTACKTVKRTAAKKYETTSSDNRIQRIDNGRKSFTVSFVPFPTYCSHEINTGRLNVNALKVLRTN